MRFTIVRHGETIGNQQRILQGHEQGDLSELGISQVRKTASDLADIHFQHIYSSDLNRAKQTAKILQEEHHESTKITYDERIRERFLGDWEGLAYKAGMWDDRKGVVLYKTPPGGETVVEHVDRIVEFINEKLEQYANEDNVLVVSHGGTIRLIIALYYGIPLPNLWVICAANAQAVFLDITEPLPSKIEVLE